MLQASVVNTMLYDKRNFLLFITGKGVSVLGASIYNFAISLYVLNLTGSALSFATNLLLGILPIVVFSPVAGVIVDRFDKKSLIIAMDLLCGVIFLVLFSLPFLSLPAIYLTSVLLTTCSTLFAIAIESAKPNLVSQKYLVRINASGKMIDSFATILGPIVGGMVFAFFSIQSFILINGISFLISALTECFLVFSGEKTATAKTNFYQDLKEGLSYFLKTPQMVSLAGIFIFINFFLGFSIQVPMPYIVNEVLSLSTRAYGFITSSFPMGMILGALYIEPLMKRYHYHRLLQMAILMMAVGAVAITLPFLLASSFSGEVLITGLYAGVMGFLGIAVALIDLPLMIMLQNTLPEHLRGRVMGLVSSIAKVILPLSLLVSGLLLQLISAYMLPLLGGLLALIYLYYFTRQNHRA